jgi:hypothetical protein
LGGKNCRCVGDDNVDVQTNQLSRHTEQQVVIALSKASLDLEVVAFDVAELRRPSRNASLNGASWELVPNPM